jgi:HlyD family secretion protein
MNRRIIGIVVVASVLGIGGYLIDRTRDAKQSLLSGYFESQPTQAASRLEGRVVQILVKEGDAVKAGQPLVRLETNSYAATFGANKMAAEQAKQQYVVTAKGNRPEDIAKQEAAVREAQADLDKLVNGPLPEEIKASRAKLREAQAQYKKMLAGSRPEEIASARAAANVALEKYRQSLRGLTPEEVAELKARYDAAAADEVLQKKQVVRQQVLYDQGAIAKKDLDTTVAAYKEAVAHTQDAKEAYDRAVEGTPKEELAQAREGYRQAQAQLDLTVHGNRKEDIEAARQEMESADQNLKLLLRGSRQEDLRAAQARLDQAKQVLLELQLGNRPEDVAKAKAAAHQAEFQAKSIAETLKEKVVYADRDAQVDRVLVADGDLVAVGAPVIQLGYPDDIWLRVYVPENQLPKVKVGDSADLAVDGVPDVVKGVVESIATSGEFTPVNLQSPEERGNQVFAVRIRLAQPDRRVKAGMYTTVKKVGLWP